MMASKATKMAALGEWVDEQGGVEAVDLGKLRDAVDSEKLGKLVMQRIQRELSSHGLGYFPRDLIDANPTPRQDQVVRLYRKGSSAAARAIEAVLDPSEPGDRYLSELGSNDAQDILA